MVVKANLNFFAIHPNRNEANSMLHVRIGLIRTSFKDDSCIFCIIDYQNGQSHHVSLLKYFFKKLKVSIIYKISTQHGMIIFTMDVFSKIN